MDPLEALAHHVRQTTTEDGYRQLAARAGIVSTQFNYVYRAAYPGRELPGGRILNPVLHGNLVKLLTELRLTFAPVDDGSPPTVAHILMLIDQLPIRPDAKSMAIHAVQRAGQMREEREAA